MSLRKLDTKVKKRLSEIVSRNDRSVLAVIGSSAHLGLPSIYSRLSKLLDRPALSVLWLCSQVPDYYETEKKKVSKLQKRLKSDDSSLTELEALTVLLARVSVDFIHYEDNSSPINSSYDLLVVDYFSHLTPEQLASCCESILSNGCIMLLLNNIQDLKELYTLQMETHKTYGSSPTVEPLFNERFLLSLMSCPTFMAVDDNLKLVPLSYTEAKSTEGEIDDTSELNVLKNATSDTQPLGCLVNSCKTLDQAKAVVKLTEMISSREKHVACLLGPRGRGKSSALGLAIAAAINLNLCNIFICTPSIEGLQIIYHHFLLGLEAAGYKEGEDYQIIRTSKSSLSPSTSSSPSAEASVATNEKIITRINIFRTVRQFVQFISPYEASRDELFRKSLQLLVIDEAASIPLEQMKTLIGPHMIFTSITDNGFRASGRGRTTNLLKFLKKESKTLYQELIFTQPINYSKQDSVENWLNSSLCLEWSENDDYVGCPSPDECQLFYINRSTLFSYHKAPEILLRRLMRLYFSSDYVVNTNVIQSMADSPDHHLFCLLPPNSHKSKVPEILSFVYLRLQDSDSISKFFKKEYGLSKSLSLTGAQVIKIAVNSKYDIADYGYDRRALQLVEEYFKGNFNIKLIDQESTPREKTHEKTIVNDLDIKPRDDCEPLFLKLEERRAEVLDYISVNCGLTQEPIKFYRRNGYTLVNINPEVNTITKEHDCLLIKSLARDDETNDDAMDIDETQKKEEESPNSWLIFLWELFRYRFVNMLSFESHFRHLKCLLAVEVLQENEFVRSHIKRQILSRPELEILMTLRDLKRLEIYTNFRDDYRHINDLISHLAKYFFFHKFDESLHLSPAQLIILLGIGLQRKDIDQIGDEIGLPGNQILAHFVKSLKKFSTWLNGIEEKAIEEELGLNRKSYEAIFSMRPVPGTLEDELEDASEKIRAEEEESRARMTQEMKHLAKYAIKGTEDEWDQRLMGKQKSIVSIKSVQPRKSTTEITPLEKSEKRKQKFKRKSK